MGLKKYHTIIRNLFIVVMIFCSFSFNIKAIEYNEDNSYEQQMSDFYEESGANELFSKLPDETQDILSQTGIDNIDSNAILNLSFDNILSVLWNGIVYEFKTPFKILCNLVGVVLITAIISALQQTSKNVQVFSIVSVLCISSLLIVPVIELIQKVSDTLIQVSEYMMSFIPVYAGIITASGKPLTAFTYNSILIVVVEGFMKIATTVLVPLSGIYLALMLVSSCSEHMNISGVIKGIRTSILWILGFIMTLFIGLLTIKSFVAKGADSVSLRAGRYIISSTIPIVGGCISEAFSVLQSSLGVINSTVGVFGIISIISLFLPSLIQLSLMSISINLAKSVSDIMEVKKLSVLFEATGFCLSLVSSILLCFSMMLIICTSLMLVLGGS